jgi:hypothetical protein
MNEAQYTRSWANAVAHSGRQGAKSSLELSTNIKRSKFLKQGEQDSFGESAELVRLNFA